MPATSSFAEEKVVAKVNGKNLTESDLKYAEAEIGADIGNLPEATRFVVIEGAYHAYFGDYGQQSGDGVPTLSRQEAQDQIRQATLEFMDSLAPKPKSK